MLSWISTRGTTPARENRFFGRFEAYQALLATPSQRMGPMPEETRVAVPQELCEDIHLAFARVASDTPGSIAALQRAVRRFTVALQNDGATPEAVLIALKAVINSGAFHVTSSPSDLRDENLRQLISSWSIEEFFGAAALPTRPDQEKSAIHHQF
ncbi:MAG: hypothetical protein ACJ8AK_07510 [Gemmatimonadaceae bacterium]